MKAMVKTVRHCPAFWHLLGATFSGRPVMSGLPQLRFHLQMQAYSPFPQLANTERPSLLFTFLCKTPVWFSGKFLPIGGSRKIVVLRLGMKIWLWMWLFTSLLNRHPSILWQSSSSKEELGVPVREGVKKKRIYLGLCPKHRTPPTHRARLGLH